MTPETERVRVCLSIAGSDSGGGAGIQADLKAFARCGVHGTTAITAITAQNTVAVYRRRTGLPGDRSRSRSGAVAADMKIDAVKIGMLGSAATDRRGRRRARPTSESRSRLWLSTR